MSQRSQISKTALGSLRCSPNVFVIVIVFVFVVIFLLVMSRFLITLSKYIKSHNYTKSNTNIFRMTLEIYSP